MLSPDYIASATDDLLILYEELEDEIFLDIARRIKITNEMTATAVRQAEVLLENGYSLNELEKKLKPYVKDINVELKDIINESSLKHYESEQKAYKQVNKDLLDLSDNVVVKNKIKECIERLVINEGHLTSTKGVVVHGKSITLDKLYKKELSKAILKADTGAFSRQTVTRNLVRTLSSSGLKEINYLDSGRNYTLESAIKMNVRTGLNQLSGEMSLSNANSVQHDLMEITAHAGARPSHAEWQGQIVSLSGDNEKYLSLNDIGYGDVTGFMGANCRHNWYPYFEDISDRMYSSEELKELDPKPFEFNDEEYTYYEATQKQRQIERTIRKYKRQALMLNELEDEEMSIISKIRLQRQRQLYNEFNKAGNLKSHENNTWIIR